MLSDRRRARVPLVLAAQLVVLVCVAAAVRGGAAEQALDSAGAYAAAERIEGLKGVRNVGRVGPGLYRGSEPNAEGLDSLKALGIRTVVNLRHYHGSREERLCRERGLDYVRIATASSDAPRDADVRRFLEIVSDPARQPVYFHCLRGKDRTSVMCAAYRMAVQDWPLEAALAEMKAFGFWRGWHDLYRYVERLAERLDRVWPVVGEPAPTP